MARCQDPRRSPGARTRARGSARGSAEVPGQLSQQRAPGTHPTPNSYKTGGPFPVQIRSPFIQPPIPSTSTHEPMVPDPAAGAPGPPAPPANARWWFYTLSCAVAPDVPALPASADFAVGQQEQGAGGFLHWQFVVKFKRCTRLPAARACFPGAHCEPTRSDAAVEYVQKEATRVPGSKFSHGRAPVKRGEKTDWDAVFSNAAAGDWDAIPRDILIRNYVNLHRIHQESVQPPFRRGVSATVLVGVTGSGKTHRAWEEMLAADGDWYIKCGRVKWWDGYRGQPNVLIDEFAGSIDITYVLRWLDLYPCTVEVKGGTKNLHAVRFWITSNLDLEAWYPDAKQQHIDALRRRVTVCYMNEAYVAPLTATQELEELFGVLPE